jgi:hypothetical protein
MLLEIRPFGGNKAGGGGGVPAKIKIACQATIY